MLKLTHSAVNQIRTLLDLRSDGQANEVPILFWAVDFKVYCPDGDTISTGPQILCGFSEESDLPCLNVDEIDIIDGQTVFIDRGLVKLATDKRLYSVDYSTDQMRFQLA